MPIDPAANMNGPDWTPLESPDPNSVPFQIRDGEFVASFSGADFIVMGYVPPSHEDVVAGVRRSTRGIEDPSPFIEFANLQTISVSTTRDVGAKRPLGTSWAERHTLGSRTIAGSLSFLTVDGDSLRSFQKRYYANSRDDATDYMPDLMPPFNVIVTGHNEFGAAVAGVIIGIQIVNTGMVLGVQDAFTEQTFSYVAQRWIPLRGLREYHDNIRTLYTENEVIQEIIANAYADPWKWVPPQLERQDELSKRIKNRKRDELIKRSGLGDPTSQHELIRRLSIFEGTPEAIQDNQ